MFRTATLLIVTVLAGGPVGSVACGLWCLPSRAGHHEAACYEVPSSHAGRQIVSTTVCDDVTVTNTFLVEARHANSNMLAATPSASWVHEPVLSGSAAWNVFDIQPPRPPSSRLILRV